MGIGKKPGDCISWVALPRECNPRASYSHGPRPLNADFFIDLITALWLAFIGGCIGSFLNVVAYRVPRGLSVVWKPSHCPKCGHAIRFRDNVPVFGWLLLGGKCRDCGQPISPRYAIVEAILGGLFLMLAYAELFTAGANLPGGPFSELTGAFDLVWHPDWKVIGLYAYHCTAVTILLTLALLDRDGERIPRRLIAFAAVVGALPPVVLGEPFLFPPSGNLLAYLMYCVVHVVGAILVSVLISRLVGLNSEKTFNLSAALSLAGLFLGTSLPYRVLYFGLFLAIFVAGRVFRRKWTGLATLDAVWLALVAVLVGGTVL